jgi:molybdopterin synthase sulfur carrier subunit
MPLDLLFFGRLRETLGRDRERVEPPSHVLTVDDLVAWLVEQGEPWAGALGDRSSIHAAVEAHAAEGNDSIFGACEVELYPPPGAL